MIKYIVKNCPSCMKDTACFSTGTFNKSFQLNGFYKCENIADCTIKQIVDECKKYSYIFSERGILASLILQILQVEDVEK